MGRLKDFILGVQETVWGFFDENGLFIDENGTKQDVLNAVIKEHGNSPMVIEIEEKEIFDIQTGDHFS